MKVFFLALSAFFSAEFHDFKFGKFELRPESNSITLFIRLDRLNTLNAIKSNCYDYNKLDQCFTDYIKGHFALAFNGEDVDIEHREYIFNDDFIELYFDIAVRPTGVNKIDIYNDVFLELDEEQENIVFIMLHDKRRSFRMNKNRIRTSVVY